MKVLLIRMNHSSAGFFSYVTFVLNQLRYAEAAGLWPVVYFGAQSGNGRNAFYDRRHGDNMWEYFFEPVAGLTHLDLCRRIADPCDPISAGDVVQLSSDVLWYLHAYDPDGIYNYPYGYYRDLPAEWIDAWYAKQRASARRLLTRYVHPKRHVRAKADAFWQANLDGHDVLGVHMRGSDKGAADARPALSRIVEPEEYFPHVDRFLDETRDPRLFLATDQSQFVDRMRARYGERLVARDVTRTTVFGPGSNPFEASPISGYTKGEEVLVDCLLLARSQRLLHCTSAVGEYAVYFNERLDSVNLNYLAPARATLPAGQTSVRAFFGPGRLFEGVILINLDGRPDRLQRSLSELLRFDLDDCVTRMSAVAHEHGQYGCSLSHLEAVRYARWKGWRSVLILEDDIKFCETFARDAPPALLELSTLEWGIFQFGVMIEPHSIDGMTSHLVRFRQGHAAHALALHARTYDVLIRDYVCELCRGNWDLPMHVPFDEYVNNRLTSFFPAYASRTLLISQHPGHSDTWNVDVDYRPLMEERYERLRVS